MTRSQAASHRRRSIRRMTALISGCFPCAQVLSLHYTLGPSPADAYAIRQYKALLCRARRLSGGPVRYVLIPEQSVIRLITDLPVDVCQELAEDWFLGDASVEPVDERRLSSLAAGLMTLPEADRAKGHKAWITSRHLAPDS